MDEAEAWLAAQKSKGIRYARELFTKLKEGDPTVVETMREFMRQGGIDAAGLYADGGRTVQGVEAEIFEAARNGWIQQARRDFKVLKEGREVRGVNFNGVRDKIRAALQKAEADEAALDPDGKKPAVAMRQEIEDARRAAWLAYAHKAWAELQIDQSHRPASHYTMPSDAYLRGCLKEAGATAAALDPTGKKDDARMEEEIARVLKQRALDYARSAFREAQSNMGMTVMYLQAMDRALERAGAEVSALDPEGKRTCAEMEEAIRGLQAAAALAKAREKEQQQRQRDSGEVGRKIFEELEAVGGQGRNERRKRPRKEGASPELPEGEGDARGRGGPSTPPAPKTGGWTDNV